MTGTRRRGRSRGRVRCAERPSPCRRRCSTGRTAVRRVGQNIVRRSRSQGSAGGAAGASPSHRPRGAGRRSARAVRSGAGNMGRAISDRPPYLNDIGESGAFFNKREDAEMRFRRNECPDGQGLIFLRKRERLLPKKTSLTYIRPESCWTPPARLDKRWGGLRTSPYPFRDLPIV